MARKPYPSDLTNTQWRLIEPLIPAVKPGGLVVLEARNQLFALFTLNRYSHQFFLDELIRTDELRRKAGPDAARLDSVLEGMKNRFRLRAGLTLIHLPPPPSSGFGLK